MDVLSNGVPLGSTSKSVKKAEISRVMMQREFSLVYDLALSSRLKGVIADAQTDVYEDIKAASRVYNLKKEAFYKRCAEQSI